MRLFWCVGIAITLIPCIGFAQSEVTQAMQQEIAKQEWQQWENRREETRVQLVPERVLQEKRVRVPSESQAYKIKRIVVESDFVPFRKYEALLKSYEGYRMGVQGIDRLVQILQAKLLKEGYITSQVEVPTQDLQSGILRIRVIPGRIESVKVNSNMRWGTWETAFPVWVDKVLNVYDLEQGIAQMNRVANQSVSMELVPGEKAYTSIVLLKRKVTSPIKIGLSLDNSGNKDTGDKIATGNIALYNPLGLQDVLTYSYGKDIAHEDAKLGSDNYYVSYRVPYGWYTLFFSQYRNHFKQTIATVQPYVSSGITTGQALTLEKVLHRNSISQVSTEISVKKKERHNYIDGEEITVQSQRTTALEYGIRYRVYRGPTQWDSYVFIRKGVGGWGARHSPWEDGERYGTPRYTLVGWQWGVMTPFKMGHRQGQYIARFVGQVARQRLYASEQISIGGQYTVRGFDGKDSLSGETGGYLQQEWGIVGDKGKWNPYLALDGGVVRGLSTENQVGHVLIGTALGLRMQLGRQWHADISVGTPLYKPKKFRTAKATMAFTIQAQV